LIYHGNYEVAVRRGGFYLDRSWEYSGICLVTNGWQKLYDVHGTVAFGDATKN
jgi:hypothetical protein